MMKWIRVEDALPECRKKVIAFYRNTHGKARRVMAQYIPPMTVKCEDFYDGIAEYVADYYDNEVEYVRESWHEIVENWSDFSGCEIVEGVVTHWMELPPEPAVPHA